jgi:hypothetical protein
VAIGPDDRQRHSAGRSSLAILLLGTTTLAVTAAIVLVATAS